MSKSASSAAILWRNWLRSPALIVFGSLLALGFSLGRGLATGKSGGEAGSAMKSAAAVFRPTPEQMATLKAAPATTMLFHTETITDGKIAQDGDTTTLVFSQYSGRVVRVIANPGDTVKRGAPLLYILATESLQGQSDLIGAAVALDTARAQYQQAAVSEKRKHGLLDARAGSLQDWEQSQVELTAAKNSLRASDAALASARERLHILGMGDPTIAAIETARRVDPAVALTAPISGTVIDRQVGDGQFVQAGAATPLYTIGNLSSVWAIGNVREAEAPLIHRGMPVEVRVMALPNRVFQARLAFVAPTVDPVTRRVAVRATIDNREGLLKPEMFASLSILSGTSSAPAIPESAIIYEGETSRIWIAQRDGTLVSRQIRTREHENGMVEVLSGLAAGERVVTSGTLFIDRAASGD